MRYRTLVACDVPAHWHPEDEHVTVIAGEVSVGFGEKFSGNDLRPLAAGSYAMIPRRQPHFTRYTAGTMVQVHGASPCDAQIKKVGAVTLPRLTAPLLPRKKFGTT